MLMMSMIYCGDDYKQWKKVHKNNHVYNNNGMNNKIIISDFENDYDYNDDYVHIK